MCIGSILFSDTSYSGDSVNGGLRRHRVRVLAQRGNAPWGVAGVAALSLSSSSGDGLVHC